MRRLAGLLLGLLLPNATADAARDLARMNFDPRPGTQLPIATALVEADGRATTLGAALGRKPAVVALVYYRCPNLCGVIGDDLMAAVERAHLAPGFASFVLVSIDPRENARVAAEAMARARARFPGLAVADWHFLTGPSRDVQRALGFTAEFDSTLDQFVHPAGIVLTTPAGAVSTSLLGVGYDPDALAHGLAAAAEERIAAPPLPVLLLCFHYDPATGRYSLAIERVMQLAAAVTVVVLGSTLWLAHRRPRA